MIYVMTMGLIQLIGVDNIPWILAAGAVGIVASIIGIRKEDKHEGNHKAR